MLIFAASQLCRLQGSGLRIQVSTTWGRASWASGGVRRLTSEQLALTPNKSTDGGATIYQPAILFCTFRSPSIAQRLSPKCRTLPGGFRHYPQDTSIRHPSPLLCRLLDVKSAGNHLSSKGNRQETGSAVVVESLSRGTGYNMVARVNNARIWG